MEAVGDADSRAIVALLRHPGTYPDAPQSVTVVETHMSWVFLTDRYAYKLNKPIRYEQCDFSTPNMRRSSCEEEVRLNRRLAADVYLGVSAITRETDGSLALDGPGYPVDWVVHMRRLSASNMLDSLIVTRRALHEEAGIRGAARHIAEFFRTASPEPISGPAYRRILEVGTRDDSQALLSPRYGLPHGRIEALARGQLALLESQPALFDHRVQADRIVEGHGDLRPEHICVRPRPAVIDCLEFSKPLRITDPVDELTFLALECERLGEPQVGTWFVDAYLHCTGDDPPQKLRRFYKVYRALRRAKISLRHLDDPRVQDPARFAARAQDYLALVEPVMGAGRSALA